MPIEMTTQKMQGMERVLQNLSERVLLPLKFCRIDESLKRSVLGPPKKPVGALQILRSYIYKIPAVEGALRCL